MDRSTVAGMMDDIKTDKSFDINNNDKKLGLLQTAFVICYMLFAPMFGYLGDRWSRKWIMILGKDFFEFFMSLVIFTPESWILHHIRLHILCHSITLFFD